MTVRQTTPAEFRDTIPIPKFLAVPLKNTRHENQGITYCIPN
jgi:hypothetical protein